MHALATLEERLGYRFRHPEVLETALTHSSFLNERVSERLHLQSNERLEFLGDAILNYLVAILIYEAFPQLGEGDLTRMRAELIRAGTLAELAREFGIGDFMRMGRGEEAGGARTRDSLLSDAFEAVLAAIFTDGGIEAARDFLIPLFRQRLEQLRRGGLPLDYKSRLQLHMQEQRHITPRYRTVSVEGTESQREYVIEVLIDGERIGVGRGPSKQAASQQAAGNALATLGVPCTAES